MEVALAYPGCLETPTGGYRYDRALAAGLEALGWRVRRVSLPDDFPAPSAQSLATARAVLAGLPAGVPVLGDGLAFGAMPAEVLDGLRGPYVALCHHPLALEAGVPAAAAERLRRSETATLQRAAAVVVTSHATGQTLERAFGVARESITVAEPGTEPAPRSAGSGDPPRLLAVGSVVPRKAHDVLVRALAQVQDLPWHCTIVGSLAFDPACAAALRALIATLGLEPRVALAGALDDAALAQAWHEADLFCLASSYEGYGMVFAEALKRGLPVVGCAGGAVAHWFPQGAGRLVPPGDVAALARALRQAVSDRALRGELAQAAYEAGARLPSWSDTARRVADTLRKVAAT